MIRIERNKARKIVCDSLAKVMTPIPATEEGEKTEIGTALKDLWAQNHHATEAIYEHIIDGLSVVGFDSTLALDSLASPFYDTVGQLITLVRNSTSPR